MNSKNLYIVDLSSFIFRAFYAIRMLNAPDGTPVNAVYGVLSMLLKILQKKDCQCLVLAQDSKEKSFRAEIYQDYKANRTAPPDELIPQFQLIDELLDVMGLSRLKIPGFEADDIIGTLVEKYQNKVGKITIVSGDKDLFQLVNEKIQMLDTMKDVTYGPEEVKTKMGILPHQVVDFLSLVGDSSDNIPGVKGIGEKGGIKLLEEFGNLDNILKSVDDIKNTKIQTAIKNYGKDAILSKKLVSLNTEVPMKFELESCHVPELQNEKFKNFLLKLGFKSLVAKIFQGTAPSNTTVNVEKEISTTTKAEQISLIDLNEKLKKLKSKTVAYFEDEFSQYLATEQGSYILNLEERDALFTTLSRLKFRTYLTNAKKILKDLKWNSFDQGGILFDIELASFTLNTEGKRSIETLAQSLLGKDELISSEEKVNAVYQIGEILFQKLFDQGLDKIYHTIDLPMLLVLAQMELEGIGVDAKYLKELSQTFSTELAFIEKEIFKSTNTSLNLKSPKQVGHLLFEKLQLPVIKKTKTGVSTDSSVLEKLDALNLSPIPGLLLQYREVDKLLSTYVNALPELIASDHRIHTTYHMSIAATGRLTSENPNLQNIPIKTEKGKLLRKAFVAKNNHVLISADYSQIELRILAHFCQDKAMLEAFKHDLDIHRQTAAEVFGLKLNQVTDEQRNYAKAINFGLIYGQSSFGLAETLNIDQKTAKNFIDKYFQKFSAVKIYLDQLREFCEKQGYAQTHLGRKRFLPDIRSSNRMLKSQAERMAINTPVQGTAADLMKLAMVNLYKKFQEIDTKAKILLQVHDELIIESPEKEATEIAKLAKDIMESALVLTVPLKVEVSTGKNWLEME